MQLFEFVHDKLAIHATKVFSVFNILMSTIHLKEKECLSQLASSDLTKWMVSIMIW